MGVFGDQLKEAREAQGLSLDTVADATRIASHHLAALERSDVAALPAGPFAKGYIEGYARFLGIDPEPILEAYRHEGRRRGLYTADAQDRIIEELSRLVEQRERTAGAFGLASVWKRLGLALLVMVVVASLAFGGWLLSRGGGSGDTPTRLPFPPAETTPEDALPPVAAPSESASAEAHGVGGDGEGVSSGARGVSRTPTAPEAAAPPESEPALRPASEAARPPATEPAPPASTEGLEVSESGVGTGVRGHELVGRGNRFTEGSRVVFWTHVLGGGPDDVIQHVWLHEGEVATRAVLAVGSPSWRTHSTRLLDLGLTGRWVVEARGPDGTMLARHEFLCVPVEGPGDVVPSEP